MKKLRLPHPIWVAGLIILTALMIGFGGSFLKDRMVRRPFDNAALGRFHSARELFAFLTSQNTRLSRPEMDAAILRLLSLQSDALKTYDKRLYADDMNPLINRYPFYSLVSLRNVKEDAVRELVRSVLADRLRISSSEGMVYFELDYPLILERFGLNASPAMADYLDIMARETKRHYSEDGALAADPDELGERLAAIEVFISCNPHFVRLTDVQKLQSQYLSALLLGLNNTPAFSYETNRLDDSFLRSYRNILQRHPGTRLATLVTQYLRVLETGNLCKTRQVLDFAEKAAAAL